MTLKPPRIKAPSGPPPPFPLNEFPANFATEVGKRIIKHVYSNDPPSLEGNAWERIFAEAIKAEWVRSKSRLDDVRLTNCAWSGKTVLDKAPSTTKRVALISGRNNLQYSYKRKVQPGDAPAEVGEMVLGVWNARLSGVYEKHEHLRTIVLIKSLDFSTYSVFEKKAVLFNADEYRWEWNKGENLFGFLKSTQQKRFTWQVNGQQFTIHEDVPETRLAFRIKLPTSPTLDQSLRQIGYDDSWITVI